MEEYKKIITHAGMFHADEVLSVALLRHYGINAPVERKFEVSPEELADPSILILDVGKVNNSSLGNFDHHHDICFPATDLLVTQWLIDNKMMSSDILIFSEIVDFLNYVSDVDRGIIRDGGPAASFNGIIRSMNPANISDPVASNEAFDRAVDLSRQIIGYQIKIGERIAEDVKVWDSLKRDFDGRVVIQEDNYQIANWTKLAKRDGVMYMVMPNPRTPGAWQIISQDSIKFEVPESATQTFRHVSGFMAVYPSKEKAIDHIGYMFSQIDWKPEE